MPVQGQVERYVELGVPALAGLSESAFRELASPLVAGADAGDLLVVDALPELLLPLVEVRGRPGYVDMTPSSPARFRPVGVTQPEAPVWAMHGFEPGDDLRDLPPFDAVARLRERGREPLTIAEGVAAALLRPELLAERHAFSLAGSRSSDRAVAKSVPALWISRGAPRLGWCWDGNPHAWLGTASCAGRSG